MCTNGGHLVNSRPSPHLTIMSFSVKIPDKLISATQSVNPTKTRKNLTSGCQWESHPRKWRLLKLNPTTGICSVWLEGWIMLVVNSPLGLAPLTKIYQLLVSDPLGCFRIFCRQSKLLTPIRVSLLAPIPAARLPISHLDFYGRLNRGIHAWPINSANGLIKP